jgi:hypothetical protein
MNKIVFVCPRTRAGKKSAHSTCAKQFAEVHDPPLQIKSNPGGGNCLFYSIAQYGKMMNFEPLNKDHSVLRREMVDYAMDHLEEFQHFFIQANHNNNSNNNNNNNNYGDMNAMSIILNKINTMYQDKKWYSEMGDIMPQILSRVYPINVMIYNVYDTSTENVEDDDVIQSIPFYHSPDAPWIYILRVSDGHFELMYPSSGAKIKSITKKEQNKIQNQNELNALSYKLQSMNLAAASQPSSTRLNQQPLSRKKSVSPPKQATRRSSRLSQKTSPRKKSVSPPKQATRKSKSSPVRRTITKSKKNKPTKQAFMSEIEGLFEMNMNEVEMHHVKQNLMNRILSSDLSDEEKAELLSILMG